MIQPPYKLNILLIKHIDSHHYKLLLNYFPQENESFLHFVWILNIFVFIFVCTNNLNYITMNTINEININVLGNIFSVIRMDYNNNEIIEFVSREFCISKEMILEHIEYLLEEKVIKKKKE